MAPDARRAAWAAIGRYGLEGARLVPLGAAGFKQTIRVSQPRSGDYVLRLYKLPPVSAAEAGVVTVASLRSPVVLRSQMAWLEALARDTGLPVPVPVPTSDGALVTRVGGEGETWARHATLVRWVPGEPAVGGARRGPSDAELRAVGDLAARIHAHAESYVPPEGSLFPRWDWDWPFGGGAPVWAEGPRFYSGEEMGLFGEASARVRALLGELGYGVGAFGLVHRDLTLGNLVFSGNGAGAIDFDLCGSGHFLLDLAVLRRSLRLLHEGRSSTDRSAAAWMAVLGGYEERRPLPGRVREKLEGYLLAFDTMQKVAAVNRGLSLLGSGGRAAASGAGRGPAFLRNSLTWLTRNVGHLAALP